jgi:hypothetical protein
MDQKQMIAILGCRFGNNQSNLEAAPISYREEARNRRRRIMIETMVDLAKVRKVNVVIAQSISFLARSSLLFPGFSQPDFTSNLAFR